MKTLKELNEKLDGLTKRENDLRLSIANDPDIVEKAKVLGKAQDDYDAVVEKFSKKIRPQLDSIQEERSKIWQEIRECRKSKAIEIPHSIQTFIRGLLNGTSWGPKGHVVKWISPNGRFIITTTPGYTGWCGIGSTRYYESSHYLYDLRKATDDIHGTSLGLNCQIRTIDGRLDKNTKKEWIKLATEKEKNNE